VKVYRLGCSGWSYGDWIGRFYSSECTQKTMLEEYTRHFDTVEINMSFYRLPFEGLVKSWRARTPQGFLFSPKMSRNVTHIKKLRGCEDLVSQFLKRMDGLGDKLGPILIQVHPGIKPDQSLLEGFLSCLPEDHRYALEFRDKRWFTASTRSVLARYGVATCLIDSPKLIVTDEVTAPFSYVRWHGRTSWYSYDYPKAEIEEWAERLRSLPVDEVFGYWNNDVDANAPRNCLEMLSLLRESERARKRSLKSRRARL